MGLKTYAILGMSILTIQDIFADQSKEKEYQLNRIETISSHLDQIDSNMIQLKQPGLLKDLMRDLPGVSVGGSSATAQRIQMRGLNQDALNVTIDGARQKGIIFHHNSNLLIDPDILKAVDIAVGTNTVVGNSGALGGSVAFKSIDAADLLRENQDFGFKIRTGYATNNREWQKSIMLYGRAWEKLELLGYVNHRSHTYGKSAPYNGKEFPGIASIDKETSTPKGAVFQIGGDGQVINSLIKAKLNFSPSHHLMFSTEHLQYDGKYPWRGEFAAYYQDPQTKKIKGQQRYPTISSRNTHTLAYHFNSGGFDLDSNLYTNIVRYKIDFEPSTIFTSGNIKSNTESSTSTSKPDNNRIPIWDLSTTNIGWKSALKNTFHTWIFTHTIAYGYEWYSTFQHAGTKAQIDAKQLNADGSSDTKKQAILWGQEIPDDIATNLSGWLEYNLKIATKIGDIQITPGFRYDYYNLKSDGFKNIYHHPLGAVGISYKAPFGLGAFANWTQLFRGPDVLEGIFLNGEPATKNSKLKPETGENYEIGIDWRQSFTDAFSIGFVGKFFHSQYQNLIAYRAGTSGQSKQHFNTGGVKINGAEIALRGSIYNLGLSFGYTNYKFKPNWTKSTEGKNIGNDIIPYYISPYSGDKYTLNVEYFFDYLEVIAGWNSLFYTSYKDSSQSKPAFNVHDLYISWVPEKKSDGFNITLGLYNITNAFYSTPYNKTNDIDGGFNAKLTLSYKY
ncbi:TonB-dependent receptor [Helicobacter sp. 11S03491-1]|uniref:TonB-dependent receptor domain-containing protein n=1 Tax=Helicobacter sp. 11S03491-1 TaxID=1476196 RepID=UPI000BA776AE|nr:TonB-dependent receptor [Helicobacter sp. 11S03491-1]PAF43454.1 hypothetical protein BKH45_02165 [Helicobacter sp. 11S03491-1]